MDQIFSTYLNELIAVISITILTIVTPGPDFVVVVRNSLSHSRRSGVYTAIGVSVAVWVHILYTLAGIGLILSKSIILFSIVKYLGAGYLVYLGVCCLRNKSSVQETGYKKNSKTITDAKSFKMGFINNALNPKATLFFLSLFTQLVSSSTPISIQVIYGAIVSISCLTWFSLVAIFLNRSEVKKAFLKMQKYIEKIMGAVLLCFGLKVAFSTTN
ncbi:MAG: LysE family transporter [Desulfocapsa sp.]|nr:LysE family transporter [Desulfocapsa sp.]MBN4058628.1 LysE family transporter [Desulfocapsa sp. AH-315-J15]